MMWPKKRFDPWKHAMEQMKDKRVLLGLPEKVEEKKVPTPFWNKEPPTAFKRVPRLRNAVKRHGWREVQKDQKLVKVLWKEHMLGMFAPKEKEPEKYQPFKSGRHFGAALKKRGFERLGGGYYSTVYAKKDSDRVIKVCHEPDGWPSYVTWAAKHGYAGACAPKVHSYKMMNGFYVAVMERMDKTLSGLDRTHPKKFMGDLFSMAAHNDNDTLFKVLEALEPGIVGLASNLLKEFGNDHIDLHNGNFMVRKDGSLVLTDPIGRGKVIKETRLRASDFTSLASLVNLLGAIFERRSINRDGYVPK